MVATGGGLSVTTDAGVFLFGNFVVDLHFEKCLGGEGVVPVGGLVARESVLGIINLMLCDLRILQPTSHS